MDSDVAVWCAWTEFLGSEIEAEIHISGASLFGIHLGISVVIINLANRDRRWNIIGSQQQHSNVVIYKSGSVCGSVDEYLVQINGLAIIW